MRNGIQKRTYFFYVYKKGQACGIYEVNSILDTEVIETRVSQYGVYRWKSKFSYFKVVNE